MSIRSLITTSDLKYTLRLLVQRPGSTLLSILVLACGLGLSIFTVTTAFTFAYKDIPLSNGEAIIRVCTGEKGNACGPFRAFEFLQIRSDISLLSSIVVGTSSLVHVESEGLQVDLIASETESGMFALSGVSAYLGRELREIDENADAEPVIVLSYDVWTSIFNSDPSIVDRTIRVDNEFRTVVGIMPDLYRFPANSQAWIPLKNSLSNPLENSKAYVTGYARVKKGVDKSEVSQEIDNLYKRMRTLYPLEPEEYGMQNVEQINSASVSTLPMALMGGRTGLIALAAMNMLSVLIFLLVSINVGTLLLARINERIKDIAIRAALGGPTPRLLVQTMSENIAITIAGGGLAILFAGFFLDLLNIFLTSTVKEEIPFWAVFTIDPSTFIAVVIFVFLTILVTCLIPGWRVVNGDFNSILRDGTRGAVGLRAGRASKNIVIAAVSLICLLLYAGALAGSFALLYKDAYSVEEAPNLIATELSLSSDQYTSNETLQLYRAISQELEQTDNILGSIIFGTNGRLGVGVDSSIGEAESGYVALAQSVFGSLKIVNAGLLEGRYFDDSDGVESPHVAIMSYSLTEKIWPNQPAIGKMIYFSDIGGERVNRRIVGVVTDTLISGQSILSPQADAVYIPMAQSLHMDSSLYVKYVGDSAESRSILRDVIYSNGIQNPIQISNYEEDQEAVVSVMNAGISLIMFCGLFAFFVALMGIYGLSSNAVVIRTQEIGTRRAIGATEARISKMFMNNGLKQVACGVLISAVISLPLSFLVFSSASTEFVVVAIPMVLVLGGTLFLSLIVSIYYPIQKILKMEPIEALRHQ